jgi:hypothetical protein
MVKASELISTTMKARGVAKFPIPAPARANQKKKGGQSFALPFHRSTKLATERYLLVQNRV